jgi:Leucine-rich repeat (LRR) protein
MAYVQLQLHTVSGSGETESLSPHTTELSLNERKLTDVPTQVTQLGDLRSLLLNHNSITKFPYHVLLHLSNLDTLRLGQNEIDDLSELSRLSHDRLTELYLSRNKLKHLPSFGAFTSLRKLYFSHNQVTSVDVGLGDLWRLEVLYLWGHKLRSLPERFGCHLTRLQHLDCADGELESIPDGFGSMQALLHLDVRNNKLKALPRSLAALPKLKTVYANTNQLRFLPVEFEAWCDHLETLYLYDNKFPVSISTLSCAGKGKLDALFEAQSYMLVFIKPAATEMLIGMQDLELPALLSLEILDELCPNLATMYVKWNLIVLVKHFRERHLAKK